MATDDDRRALMVKEIRRGILDLLNLAYPAAISFESICEQFLDTDEHYIRRDLEYFQGRKLIVWVNPARNAPWSTRKYKLTSDGVDEALRINTDPALEP